MISPHFYNTLSRSKEPLIPIKGGEVKMYTCGPTVYDFAHIGNCRAYVFEDLLQRYLETIGYQVQRVMNFTDVDDKTIRNSRAQNKPLADFTHIYKQAFLEDLRSLNIKIPSHMPSATEYIPRIIEMIQILEKKGIAYQAEDRSVYYRIAQFPDYGKLAHLNLEELQPSGRIQNDEYEKENIGDFALWKSATAEDGEVKWDSPWGVGRPGWHIECSAMSTALLGNEIDIHCGGVDNIFPHHEAEIAQSEACTGHHPFVRLWMHCAHLQVNGQKMSKSLGNFYTLRDLIAQGYSGRQVRYLLLYVHYRTPLNFTLSELEAVKQPLNRIDEWVKRLKERVADTAHSILADWWERFAQALADDLNISAALAVLFDAIRDSNRLLDRNELTVQQCAEHLAAWQKADQILGVAQTNIKTIPVEVLQLIEERKMARTTCDWKRSDQLRDQIQQLGWQVKDTPKGTEVLPL